MSTEMENSNWSDLVALESQITNKFLVLYHSVSQSSRHSVVSKNTRRIFTSLK